MSSEKRTEPRFEVTTSVLAQWANGGDPVECAASDISAHGIFLELAAPPAVETAIVVGPAGAAVHGRVVFCLSAADAAAMGRKPGVGVQLDASIDPDAFLLRCAEASRAVASTSSSESRTAARASSARAAQSTTSLSFAAVAAAAAGAPLGNAAGARRPQAVATEEPLSDVVVVDGVGGQGAIVEALAVDGYGVFVAKHGLEGLVLCLRRRPVLLIAGAAAARLDGRALVAEVRRHAALDATAIALVDESDDGGEPRDAHVVRWRSAPADVDRARRLVDAALGQAPRAEKRPRGPDDARVFADAVNALARRLDARDDVAAAIGAARYAAEIAPSSSAHTLLVARLLLASPDRSERDEAARLVERVVRQDPRSAEGSFLRAVVCEQRGRRDEAKGALQRALMFAPGDAVAATDALARLAAGEPLLRVRAAPSAATVASAPEAGAAAPAGGGLLGKLFGKR